MNILYVAPYQGTRLLSLRPAVANRSLAANAKIATIVGCLHATGHRVAVLSEGEVDRYTCRLYPGFVETDEACPDTSITYAPALPLRGLSGLWASGQMQRLLDRAIRQGTVDALIVYNLKRAHLACIRRASVRHGLPVILQYEDDAFVDVRGRLRHGILARLHERQCLQALRQVTGGIAVSPRLQAQFPAGTPTLLLPGVVADDLLQEGARPASLRRNIVLFSGGHFASKGVEPLIEAWRTLAPKDWELHVTGCGPLSPRLRQQAARTPGVVFHGLVSRKTLVAMMCVARVCINPHDISVAPGNVFAFKLVEYLAAGAHVVTTRMGRLAPELEVGITYMPDNAPETIARTLRDVFSTQQWCHTAREAACLRYGPAAIANEIDVLLRAVACRRSQQPTRSRSDPR